MCLAFGRFDADADIGGGPEGGAYTEGETGAGETGETTEEWREWRESMLGRVGSG